MSDYLRSKQIGRNVYFEDVKKTRESLNLVSKLLKSYYEFRIKLINRRMRKYRMFTAEERYKKALYNAHGHHITSFLMKIDALYLKAELRAYERRVKERTK